MNNKIAAHNPGMRPRCGAACLLRPHYITSHVVISNDSVHLFHNLGNARITCCLFWPAFQHTYCPWQDSQEANICSKSVGLQSGFPKVINANDYWIMSCNACNWIEQHHGSQDFDLTNVTQECSMSDCTIAKGLTKDVVQNVIEEDSVCVNSGEKFSDLLLGKIKCS